MSCRVLVSSIIVNVVSFGGRSCQSCAERVPDCAQDGIISDGYVG